MLAELDGEEGMTLSSVGRGSRAARRSSSLANLSPVAPARNPAGSSGNGAGEAVPMTLPQPAQRAPVVLTLPEPPAANRYLRQHGHVTYKTREAKAYCELVAALAHEHRQNGGPVFPDGDVTVTVIWHRGRKAGDLGERTKVLYDSLQGTVYADDKQIAQDWRRRCDGHPSVPKGSMRIEVSRYVEPFPETV
jgi:Holliday junction resolvase RusA-like endonuclease